MKYRLFAYGSLRTGERAHNLVANSVLLEEYAIASGYKLYSCGGFPTLIATNNPEDKVVGEIYEVNHETLTQLDEYEGVKEMEYIRNFDSQLRAYVYSAGPNSPTILSEIPSGDWKTRPDT